MFSINKTTKSMPSGVLFRRLKKEILGDKYDLSLVFVGDYKSRTLNNRYRGKNKVANVLTFPLGAETGEIFINTRQAARDCKKFNLSPKKMVDLLFIHGLLHLKGEKHGSTMEDNEWQLLNSL